jgi:predicted dehydrogenase
MIKGEKRVKPEKRMHFVAIVTPNHMHFPPAKMALENGFHVVCDKPVAFNLQEALKLEKIVEKTGLLFALTHNYTGYPMVKQARQMIRHGELGAIRKVVVEYPQGWLSTHLEASGNKQASWRTDPSKSGAAGAMGDIGTHAENLAEYITGQHITEMCADVSTFVPGRLLDDDGNVLIRLSGGAKGILHASQIAAGEENNLAIRVYGEKGGLEWRQMEPNTLIVRWLDQPTQMLRTGVGKLYPESLVHARIPAGHPEGYLEAFANIYRNFAVTLRARLEGREPDPLYTDFPTVSDGVRGMKFIEQVIKSGKMGAKWVKV